MFKSQTNKIVWYSMEPIEWSLLKYANIVGQDIKTVSTLNYARECVSVTRVYFWRLEQKHIVLCELLMFHIAFMFCSVNRINNGDFSIGIEAVA